MMSDLKSGVRIHRRERERYDVILQSTDFRMWARRESPGNDIYHSHPHLELHVCEEGSGYIQAGRVVHPLAPGRATLIYGPEAHRIHADPVKPYRRVVAIFPLALPSTGLVHGINDILSILPTKETPCIQFQLTPLQQTSLIRLLSRSHEKCASWKPTHLFHICHLMGEIFQVLKASSRCLPNLAQSATPYEKWIVTQVEEMIHQGNDKVLEISYLSQALNMSPSHLWRIYTKVRGRTIREYISLIKLSLAESSLRVGCTVTEAASASYYTHVGSFSRAFKQHMGISPQVYRSWIKESERVLNPF